MKTPTTDWRELANIIGLENHGGIAFKANEEYVDKIKSILEPFIATVEQRAIDKAWEYCVKALRDESASKKKLIEFVTNTNPNNHA